MASKDESVAYVSTEDEHDLRFTVYVRSFGKKAKCVNDIGLTLSRVLWTEFGDKYKLTDHRSRLVEFNPKAHYWGLGENWVGTQLPREPEEVLVIDGVRYRREPPESVTLDNANTTDVV